MKALVLVMATLLAVALLMSACWLRPVDVPSLRVDLIYTDFGAEHVRAT